MLYIFNSTPLMSVLSDDGCTYYPKHYPKHVEIFLYGYITVQYFGTWVNFCLFIISCKEDYKAKVMFSLFPSPSGRNQMFNNGKHQKKCSRIYVSRGVLHGILAVKRYRN